MARFWFLKPSFLMFVLLLAVLVVAVACGDGEADTPTAPAPEATSTRAAPAPEATSTSAAPDATTPSMAPAATATSAAPAPVPTPTTGSMVLDPTAPAELATVTPVAPPTVAGLQPRYGGVYPMSMIGGQRTWDPHAAAVFEDHHCGTTMYNQLIQYNPINNNEIIADLAHSWESSEDGLTWTFRLTEGVNGRTGWSSPQMMWCSA